MKKLIPLSAKAGVITVLIILLVQFKPLGQSRSIFYATYGGDSYRAEPLEDCYYFTSMVVPARIEVLNDLRNELNKRKLRP